MPTRQSSCPSFGFLNDPDQRNLSIKKFERRELDRNHDGAADRGEPERPPDTARQMARSGLKSRAWSVAANLLILVLALVLSMVLAELALRIFHPVYEYAADFLYDPSTTRIWRNHSGRHQQLWRHRRLR